MTRSEPDERLEASSRWSRVVGLLEVTAFGDEHRRFIDEDGNEHTEAFDDLQTEREED